MVEIRVAVEDGRRPKPRARALEALRQVTNLVRRVTQRGTGRVRVGISRGHAVSSKSSRPWLSEDGTESATLSIGDRSYTLVTSTPLEVVGR